MDLRQYEILIDTKNFITQSYPMLRCSFDVTTYTGDSLSTCEFRLWNLAPTTKIEPNQTVVFRAGYQSRIGQIFTGFVTNVFTIRDGTDIITRVTCRSGSNVLDGGTTTASFGKGVTLFDVLTSLAQDWSKPLYLVNSVDKFTSIVMAGGYNVSSDISKELDILAKAYGFEWHLYAGQVFVGFPSDDRKATPVKISSATGMIDAPTLHGGIDGVFCDVKMRLDPRMTPASVLNIESKWPKFDFGAVEFQSTIDAKLEGDWNVQTIQHTGDTHGPDWYTFVKAVRAGSMDTTTTNSDVGNRLIYGRVGVQGEDASQQQDFRTEVRKLGQSLGISPNWIMAVISAESNFNPQSKNSKSGAVGLIQFTNVGWTSAFQTKYGRNKSVILSMTAAEQVKGPITDYLNQYKGRYKTMGDLYMAVFSPAFIGKPSTTVMYSSPSKAYNQNAGLDTDHKGYITVGDVWRRVEERFRQGKAYML